MLETQDLRAAYARVFSAEDGKRVLEDLGRLGMARQTTFHPEGLRMAFNEGRRSLVLHIEHMLAKEKAERGGPERRGQGGG